MARRAVKRTIGARKRLAMPSRDCITDRAARTVTSADRPNHCDACIDRSAAATLRSEGDWGRATALADQRDKAADMGCGEGAPVDEKPSTSRFRGWHIPPRRNVNVAE